ncbi:hypothetical protein IV203_013669 [Nitzschia inconspicua]|uniref:Uncharacterized protein n=1 Tax=Nitzschia inconspicua TaxID=303405 RepID=A0A9K3M5Z6_9STRA|nr:hypothetical protein IV203_013669 [Nitzschia inconspicua]
MRLIVWQKRKCLRRIKYAVQTKEQKFWKQEREGLQAIADIGFVGIRDASSFCRRFVDGSWKRRRFGSGQILSQHNSGQGQSSRSNSYGSAEV